MRYKKHWPLMWSTGVKMERDWAWNPGKPVYIYRVRDPKGTMIFQDTKYRYALAFAKQWQIDNKVSLLGVQ